MDNTYTLLPIKFATPLMRENEKKLFIVCKHYGMKTKWLRPVISGFLNHYTRCRTAMLISNASRWRVLFSELPAMYKAMELVWITETVRRFKTCLKKWLCVVYASSFLFRSTKLLLLCCIVKESCSNGLRVDSRRCRKRRRIIRADNENAANILISWIMVRYVVLRFC